MAVWRPELAPEQTAARAPSRRSRETQSRAIMSIERGRTRKRTPKMRIVEGRAPSVPASTSRRPRTSRPKGRRSPGEPVDEFRHTTKRADRADAADVVIQPSHTSRPKAIIVTGTTSARAMKTTTEEDRPQ